MDKENRSEGLVHVHANEVEGHRDEQAAKGNLHDRPVATSSVGRHAGALIASTTLLLQSCILVRAARQFCLQPIHPAVCLPRPDEPKLAGLGHAASPESMHSRKLASMLSRLLSPTA